jgi:hypothetical protein
VHPHQHRIDLCNKALEAVRPAIPVDLFRDVDDYINRFDEWGLGMEELIGGLTELGIEIGREQFDLIQAAMDSMGLGDCDRVMYLREHGVPRRPSPPTDP